jgi:hypothetical protein
MESKLNECGGGCGLKHSRFCCPNCGYVETQPIMGHPDAPDCQGCMGEKAKWGDDFRCLKCKPLTEEEEDGALMKALLDYDLESEAMWEGLGGLPGDDPRVVDANLCDQRTLQGIFKEWLGLIEKRTKITEGDLGEEGVQEAYSFFMAYKTPREYINSLDWSDTKENETNASAGK